MRRFVVVSHTVPVDGQWGLDDLAGAAGRVDVVCRAITSALFTSHGIRDDTEVVVVFAAGVQGEESGGGGAVHAVPGREDHTGGVHRLEDAKSGMTGAVAVRIRGSQVQRLNPDERSTAARLRNALRHAHPDAWWEPVEGGIEVAPFGLAEVLDDLAAPVVWLDRGGQDVMERPLSPDVAWVLSDHGPFSDGEAALIAARAQHRLSLGPMWYHGHHVVGVVQFLLDRQDA